MKYWLLIVMVAVVFFSLGMGASGVREIRVPIKEFIPVINPTPEPPKVVMLLPDLVIFSPDELYITRPKLGIKNIRFNTTVANVGKGPFEVIGHTDKERGTTFASQYIKNADGTGSYKEIGEFIYHDVHNHWHVEDYVKYQIKTYGGNEAGVGGEVLASSGKMSFCLWDVSRYDTELENAPKSRGYLSTCSNRIQGISVGWQDTYLSRIEGQSIDISNIADGIYILEYEVNPDRKFEEGDYANNRGELKVEIIGTRIKVVE